MNMRVAIRTDASSEMGIGHVMRCLTLAEALRDRGAFCQFICREHSGNLLDLIRERGFTAHALPLGRGTPSAATAPEQGKRSPYASWLGADWQTDARQTKAALGNQPLDWLIVDHYALDSKWEVAVKESCRKVFVIDDLADRHHHCELLLDQTYGRNIKDYEPWVPTSCTLLCGSQYALLRPDFAPLRAYSLNRRLDPNINHLLVSMGGVDKDNVTTRVMQALQFCDLPASCVITVVMGKNAPWLENVRQQAQKLPWPATVVVDVKEMATLMANCDLAIGAAGSTSWERCCLGLPTLMIVLAENQRLVAQCLERLGAVRVLASQNFISDQLPKVVNELCASPDALRAMTANAANTTEGTGVNTVMRYLGS